MVNNKGFDIQIERVDDIPLVYRSLEKMGIQAIIDKACPERSRRVARIVLRGGSGSNATSLPDGGAS